MTTTSTQPQKLTGLGRNVIESRLIEAEAERADLREKLASAERDRDAYLTNLTTTQARATELLNVKRLDTHFETRPNDAAAFLALAWAVNKARAKHPRGPDGIRSLAEEIGEVANAMRRETPERVREELLDVCVVALRWYLGESSP